jgi:hypothetical protein
MPHTDSPQRRGEGELGLLPRLSPGASFHSPTRARDAAQIGESNDDQEHD